MTARAAVAIVVAIGATLADDALNSPCAASAPNAPIAATSSTTGAGFNGTTGLINTPSAAVTPHGAFRLGFTYLDADWSYIGRGQRDNRFYYFTLGFLPRVEISVRATIFRERDVVVEGEQTVADRVASARVRLLNEGRFPSLAIGGDDLKGNRRTHSLYAVSTKTVRLGTSLMCRASVGFGSRWIEERALLDGAFGGLECGFPDALIFLLENDTEKWNAGLRVVAFSRLTAQVALLHFETISGGVGWTQGF